MDGAVGYAFLYRDLCRMCNGICLVYRDIEIGAKTRDLDMVGMFSLIPAKDVDDWPIRAYSVFQLIDIDVQVIEICKGLFAFPLRFSIWDINHTIHTTVLYSKPAAKISDKLA
jgi:hypothetical protein